MVAAKCGEFLTGVFNNLGFTEDEERDGPPEIADVQRLIVCVEKKDFVFGHGKSPQSMRVCRVGYKKTRESFRHAGFVNTFWTVYEGVEEYGRTPAMRHHVLVANLHHYLLKRMNRKIGRNSRDFLNKFLDVWFE